MVSAAGDSFSVLDTGKLDRLAARAFLLLEISEDMVSKVDAVDGVWAVPLLVL